MSKFCLLFVTWASVSSNPVMKYSFCSPSNVECEPVSFGSNSLFEFGNITAATFFYVPGEANFLVVSCNFHEPIQWIFSHTQFRIKVIANRFTHDDGSRPLYHYSIKIAAPFFGMYRCQSYEEPDLAAEIYVARLGQENTYWHPDDEIHKIIPTETKRGLELVVPCVMSRFSPNFDPRTSRLKKLGRLDMTLRNITRNCFRCFPQTYKCGGSLNTSCPYGVNRKLWTDAGQLPCVNESGKQWLDGFKDPECALEIVRKVPLSGIHDCNYDGELTCSDNFGAISSYPSRCNRDKDSFANFREIETCMVKNFAQLLDSDEAFYDPRIGFRLKSIKDMNAFYFCVYESQLVYWWPHNPRNKFDVRLQYKSNDDARHEHLKGIFCLTPQKWMENTMHMDFFPCSTLLDCEINLLTVEGRKFMELLKTVKGVRLSTISPERSGKIIQNPPSSGVVRCAALYGSLWDYIWDLQFFFIGLDLKPYFTSDDFPVEAVISLKILQQNLTETNGLEMEVECMIAAFILYPNIEYLAEHSNGTVSKIEQGQGLQRQRSTGSFLNQSHLALRSTLSFNDLEPSIFSIRCRAPLRNSKRYAEAYLKVELVHELDEELSVQDGRSNLNLLLVIILAAGSFTLISGTITCAVYSFIKYRKTMDLRQLTLKEMDEFWNGNTAVRAPTSSAAQLDRIIGFPECFIISPTDLKIRMEEKLGAGEFGVCVMGDWRGGSVAVKMINPNADIETLQDFLREVKIRAYLGEHVNIVGFLGAVVNQLSDGIIFAALELSPCGDLLSYLRHGNPENPRNVHKYENLPHEERNRGSHPKRTSLGVSNLSYFCEQIAAAMDFCVEKRVIHGDLAARNVLVFPENVVKISDFGLSRKLYTAANYNMRSSTPLPWRWMAIESLKYMEFSAMTDMWAFGVTAWEIFTLGQVPFAEQVYSSKFVKQVDGGMRMKRPELAPESMYS